MALDVSPGRFAEHLAVLRAKFVPLALEEFEALRQAGRLPARAVAVTFDDGYADNLTPASVLLRDADVSATVFVTAGMVGSAHEFWWDDVERIAFSARALGGGVPIAGVTWTAEREPAAPVDAAWTVQQPVVTARQQLFVALCEALRAVPPSERDARVRALREWAGVPAAARTTHRTLTHTELVALAVTQGITIGAHTITHPVLAALPPQVQVAELSESATQLAAWTKTRVSYAAYPFGTEREVSVDTVRAARRAGLRAAFANTPSPAWQWSDAWRVPRCLVRDWTGVQFERQLRRWWME